ncbi:UDP-glycosyltransferase 88F3 isoform X1 [Ricinus communis]|uniref:UDP-glycosyltransferase 88F3 isoform X1 n=1 Tax=Ricinus communis TaxID=3988 RepID=UPI000772D197|nr:UDP-glycosyltransferase 88F3 isoform X1 [Ricinus communis]|eukprot:XP_015576377.1 UDP-glycosyltransferase 88F3 isoform X1 [Ricinus communis]
MQDTIVLYPSSGIGHVISMVELGKLILRHYNHHFSITILLFTADLCHTSAITSYINAISQAYPSISFRRFPRVFVDTTPTRSNPAMAFEAILLNKPYVLDSLQEISKGNNVRAFIIDIFCGSALSIGKDLKIPTYYFFTSGAACLGAFLYFPRIHEQHTESFKDLVNTVLDFPGMPPLKAVHFPEPMLDRNDPAYHDMVYFCSNLAKADGIIVNTFEDLETKAIKTIADGVCVPDAPTPPTYYIGPLIAGDSRHEAQHDCLSWLDRQPRNSVVFLCFGSRGSFSRQQLKEIANGLERSGQRFLWVVKNLPEDERSKTTEDMGDFDLESILPEGFLNRVKEKAMVVKSWAPQVAVLNHKSVGGFVTHCGWNSVLEAVVAGVPMVAWPLYAEQHLNRNILVEDMKMAIQVEQRDDDDGFVTGDELEVRVRELMESEKGKEMRQKSWMMRQRSLDSWLESGSSIRALGKLVEPWKKIC